MSYLRLFYSPCLFTLLTIGMLFSGVSIAGAMTPIQELQKGIERYLVGPRSPRYPDMEFDRLKIFYQQRDFLPVWHSSSTHASTSQAFEVREAIRQSGTHGFEPANYHFPDLISLWSSTQPEDRVLLDILLTDALFRYARHLYEGQTRPHSVDKNWHIEGNTLDVPGFLQEALESGDFAGRLAGLAPRHLGYRRLAVALDNYRKLALLGGWGAVDKGPTLRPGDTGRRVELLRSRLWKEGHLLGLGNNPDYFDAELEAAVRRFQRLHTLEEDGLVGRKTLAALNVPVDARIAQIQLNLERWRWLPRELDQRYLLVNMAGFELKAYENGEPSLGMRVIIGKPFRSTPAFSGKLTHVVLNPYWNVPQRIADEDLIPAQIRDGNYLAKRGIRVLESWEPNAVELDPNQLNWETFVGRPFPYRLRQDPGPINSLGRIKFMLPNPFSIYLHDTPERQLFQRTVRTFSSGCIRVEDPEGLAEFLFAGSEGWQRQRLRALIESGDTRTQYLPRSVTVYLVYLTAWVDNVGQLRFSDDIYARDGQLAARLPRS